MMTAPATRTATRTTTDPKAKARGLRDRLLRGFDLIAEARGAGDQIKAASLQELYNQLEADYQEAKRSFAKTPEDLFRCPDCPNLGRGPLREVGDVVIICENNCRKYKR